MKVWPQNSVKLYISDRIYRIVEMTEPDVITYSLNSDPPGIMNSTSFYNNSDAEDSADNFTLLEWARNFVSTEVSADTKK